MSFHVNTRNGCVVLTCRSVKHSFKREYPDFKQFVTFTDKLAREACDPVYGYEAMKTTKLNFVSDYSKSPSLLDDRCVACKGSHSLTQYGQFKAMRPYQRL